VSVEEALNLLREKGLPEAIMVDCSHANCRKKHQGQAAVWQNVINQRIDGNDALVGLMLESYIQEGCQKIKSNPAELKYGVSITDQCISWETTERLFLGAHEQLQRHFQGGGDMVNEPATANGRYKVA
jgi:3-deoxy-7-phosphoheptulonate synthase